MKWEVLNPVNSREKIKGRRNSPKSSTFNVQSLRLNVRETTPFNVELQAWTFARSRGQNLTDRLLTALIGANADHVFDG